LDSLNTQATDQVYVRRQMVKYLRAELAAPTGARLAIFTLGQKLRMVRGFTADSSASLKALIDPKSGTEAKFEPQMASPWRIVSENRACDGIRSPAGQAACRDFMAEERAERAGDRVSMTLQAFQALARYLSQFPGRKNVMWISGSFPLSFFPETSPRGVPRKEYRSDTRQTADLLTADQVAVYPISARALTGEENTHTDNYGRPIDEGSGDRAFDQIAMETLARDTGGRPFYNTNDLSNAMTDAVNSGSHYYTLTYTPTNMKMDGKYRRIELKATNGNYKLAYRRGYYAENPKTEQAAEQSVASDHLLPLMSFGMPDFAEILFKVRVAPLRGGSNADPKKSVVRYSVDFAISPQDVKLETSAGGVCSGNIQVALIAYDNDGKTLKAVTRKVPIHLQPDVFATLQQVGFQLHEEIDLPKGDVFLQTGIYDLTASHAGTLGIPLHVVAVPAATK
jgi:VWFA-related protein